MLDNSYADVADEDTLLAEMRAIVRAAAAPWQPGDSVKAGILRASRRLGIGFRRARTFWYGGRCAVRAGEADRLRKLAAAITADRARGERQAAMNTAARLRDDVLAQALRGGADDARPLLPPALGSVAAAGRWAQGPCSPLVVSAGYVGPERRHGERRHSG